MATMAQIFLIIMGVTLLAVFMGITIGLLYDRMYIRKRLLRLVVYRADRSIFFAWGKKLKEKEEDNNLVQYNKSIYFYKPDDIIKVGTYSGIEVYENNFKALVTPFEAFQKKTQKTALNTDFTKLEKDSKLTTHPSILHLIVSNKFLRELLEQNINWRDILLIAVCVLVVASLVANLYFLPKLLTLTKDNAAAIQAIPETMLRMLGKVA